MNVILLMVDTLRVDHLGISGYSRNTSPNIDTLAKEGTFFSNTYSVLPNSDPSVTSMLTGLYPYSHGVRMLYNNKLDTSITTLPEILKARGYRTASFKAGNPYPPGVERGFDDYSNTSWKIENKLKRALYKVYNPKNFISVTQQYADIGMRWIKNNSSEKFFLLFHFIDLHWPYIVPKPFDHMFDPDYKGKHDFIDLKKGAFKRGDLIFGNMKVPDEERNHVIAHYDGGIRYIDTQIGKMLDFLKKQGLEEETLVILVSDHGENFGEHNVHFAHGSSLYNPSLRVPLIFRNPKIVPKGRTVKSQAQTLDIMPTILDALKIPLIDKIDGVSLMPLIEGKSEKTRDYLFIESNEKAFEQNPRMYFEGTKGKWRSLIKGKWKLIYIPHPEEDQFELYDLENDPGESNNLVNQEKEKASELKEKLFELLRPQSNEGKTVLTERSRKLLRKMGYVN